MNREADLYVNHIHEDKEKEEETIIIHNPSWHSAFAGDCSIRWSYLSVGSGLLSPTTRLRQIRPDNVVLRCRAILRGLMKRSFIVAGLPIPIESIVLSLDRGAVRPHLLFAVTYRKCADLRVSAPRRSSGQNDAGRE
jgi:hypothetical protein